MKFQLRTLLIVTTLTAVCIGVFVSHQNSITQVQAIEKKVDSLLEDTILDMKTQWIAESRDQIESDPAYQGKKISEEVIHVFRGSEDEPLYCEFSSPTRHRMVGGLSRGRTLLARSWGMTMMNLDNQVSKSANSKSEDETRQVSLWVEHQVPWRLFAAQPETTLYGQVGVENARFLKMLTKRLEQAGIEYKVANLPKDEVY